MLIVCKIIGSVCCCCKSSSQLVSAHIWGYDKRTDFKTDIHFIFSDSQSDSGQKQFITALTLSIQCIELLSESLDRINVDVTTGQS